VDPRALGRAGGAALVRLLRWSGIGARRPLVSQIDPVARISTRYRWRARMTRWADCWQASAPGQVHVPLNEPCDRPLAGGGAPAGGTPISWRAQCGVRLCQAHGRGVEIDGAEFTSRASRSPRPVWPSSGDRVSGPPCTAAATPERPSGTGALPAWADDLHLFHDLFAVIQPLEGGPPCGMQPSAPDDLARMTAPLILLNVATGDQAC